MPDGELKIAPAPPLKPRNTVPMNVPVQQFERIKPLTRLAAEIMGASRTITAGPGR